jgi:hypothetical protein
MRQSCCNTCNHANYLHDVWGICCVSGCKPCHIEAECPRCGHTFNDHTVSEKIVFCMKRNCNYVTCYNKNHPEAGLLRSPLPLMPRHPVLPLPPANAFTPPTYESMLPARYRDIPVTPPPPPPDPVEKGYL